METNQISETELSSQNMNQFIILLTEFDQRIQEFRDFEKTPIIPYYRRARNLLESQSVYLKELVQLWPLKEKNLEAEKINQLFSYFFNIVTFYCSDDLRELIKKSYSLESFIDTYRKMKWLDKQLNWKDLTKNDKREYLQEILMAKEIKTDTYRFDNIDIRISKNDHKIESTLCFYCEDYIPLFKFTSRGFLIPSRSFNHIWRNEIIINELMTEAHVKHFKTKTNKNDINIIQV